MVKIQKIKITPGLDWGIIPCTGVACTAHPSLQEHFQREIPPLVQFNDPFAPCLDQTTGCPAWISALSLWTGSLHRQGDDLTASVPSFGRG